MVNYPHPQPPPNPQPPDIGGVGGQGGAGERSRMPATNKEKWY